MAYFNHRKEGPKPNQTSSDKSEDDEDAWGEAVVAEPSEGVSSPVQISDALTGLTATDGKKLRFICYFWGGRRAQGTDWMVWRMEAMPE